MQRSTGRLQLRIFGSPRLFLDGVELDVAAPPRTLLLLAYVALSPAPVSRATLANVFWPDNTAEEARSNVRRHLHALHRGLRAAGVEHEIVRSERTRVTIPRDLLTTDIAEYERLAATDATLDAAIALYLDEVLAGSDDTWIVPTRERFRCLHWRTLLRASDRTRSQDLTQALTYVTAAAEIEPWHEDIARAAIMLHWQGADRAAARRAFDAFASRLDTDIGSEPSASLRELAGRVESGAPYGVPGNMPQELELTSFVGREDDIERLATLCLEQHVCVLTGPPGVGKTRLSLRVARRIESHFPDGVWFVDLSPLRESDSIEAAIISVLAGSGNTTASLRDVFGGKRVLVLIDNCEHVTQAATRAIEHAAPLAVGSRILATSRTVLGVRGATSWTVRPLPETAAVELFLERAREAHAEAWSIESRRPAIAALCDTLDRLPLAIELAAARLRTLPFAEIVARISERFALLEDDGPRALRTTLEWSYALLSDSDKAFLRSLTAFRGGWTIGAAAALSLVDEWTAIGSLQRLIDRSLVVAPLPDALVARYDMLASLREYTELVTSPQELYDLRVRHAEYFASTWHEDDEGDPFAVERRTEYGAALRDYDNLRSAFDTLFGSPGLANAGVELVTSLGFFWVDSVPADESRRRLEGALESGAGTMRRRAALLLLRSRLSLRGGDARAAGADAGAAFVLATETGDDALVARTLMARARAAWMLTELDEAGADAAGALEKCVASGHVYGQARAQSTLYLVYVSAGRIAEARACASAAADLYRAVDARVELGEALANMGTCAYYQSDIAGAATYYREALAHVSGSGNDRMISFIEHNLASTEWETGRVADAWHDIGNALQRALRISYPPVAIRSIELIARWCVATDPYEAAVFAAAAQAASEAYDARFQSVEHDDHARLAAAIEAALTPHSAQRARAEGTRLDLDGAVRRAIAFAGHQPAPDEVTERFSATQPRKVTNA